MLDTIAIFLISFVALSKSAHWVLNATIRIAKHFNIAEFAAGYLLIAIATSVPDFMVSVTASYFGNGGIAMGDVIGSSIANICLVLGIAAIIHEIKVQRKHTMESAELLLLISIIPLILLSRGTISRIEGLLLILIFLIYCLFVVKERFTLRLSEGVSRIEWTRSVIYLIFGMIIVILSSRFVVNSGEQIARYIGVSDALIGMTIIALGTTLPELAIDFTAIRRGHIALAIGDILGSCVVNLTLVLGAAAIINPLGDGFTMFTTAIAFLLGVNFFLWYVFTKHEGISKTHGLIFVLTYIFFIMIEMALGIVKVG